MTYLSLTVWAAGDQEGACGGFSWGSIYPHWWWSCNHDVTDRDCIYCWRQYQSQPFCDQYSYYLASAQTCQPTREELVPAAGRSTRGMGYPQGLSYNLPVRDATPFHHHPPPPGHGHTHERVRARASHPAQSKAYGKVFITKLGTLVTLSCVVLIGAGSTLQVILLLLQFDPQILV